RMWLQETSLQNSNSITFTPFRHSSTNALSSPSESIVHHFAFFSSSSKRIVRRKEGFLREEGDG
ncbi:hypothetical protein ALC60_04905, partial [Trachymyrmex zeteki]